MIDKSDMIDMLRDWGRWQRTATESSLGFVSSQHDTPLQKQRNVKPIYYNPSSELLDELIVKFLNKSYKACLILSYVEREPNLIAAAKMEISLKSFLNKRNEAIACLCGVYTVHRAILTNYVRKSWENYSNSKAIY